MECVPVSLPHLPYQGLLCRGAVDPAHSARAQWAAAGATWDTEAGYRSAPPWVKCPLVLRGRAVGERRCRLYIRKRSGGGGLLHNSPRLFAPWNPSPGMRTTVRRARGIPLLRGMRAWTASAPRTRPAHQRAVSSPAAAASVAVGAEHCAAAREQPTQNRARRAVHLCAVSGMPPVRRRLAAGGSSRRGPVAPAPSDPRAYTGRAAPHIDWKCTGGSWSSPAAAAEAPSSSAATHWAPRAREAAVLLFIGPNYVLQVIQDNRATL
ncbi:hypothetical protein BU26DRAFT_264315 [Trematosphaeria pertusa]|uniref:Uncharacterized protein n=1 Tax=Trematosphaeria pertusa TaxID=390896 RepID=A0A6A6IIR8_9PLEO|nr:uncharacterized protein BU26DRAFT_264315 [Trematosphaeria pertusa]KAF2250495.1 hypothetical protein BU26DRAFT_264315 [Trematosphaeria pertusa]